MTKITKLTISNTKNAFLPNLRRLFPVTCGLRRVLESAEERCLGYDDVTVCSIFITIVKVRPFVGRVLFVVVFFF